MRIQERWRWWLNGRSKFGLGVQGNDYGTVDRLGASKVLFLDESKDYARRYGPNSILRTYHGLEKNWKDPVAWAWGCGQNIDEVHHTGCRDLQPINEVWGVEGLGKEEKDYEWMGNYWGPVFLDALERELHARGKAIWPEPDGWRVWLWAESPGQNYEDNFQGVRYLVNVLRDPRVFGRMVHHYWQPWGGFLGEPDCSWNGPCRLLAVRKLEQELGIDLPYYLGEYNRKVNRAVPQDIWTHSVEIKDFVAWTNSLDWMLGSAYFLACAHDSSHNFHDFTLNRMDGMLDYLSNWDRYSEGRWRMPQVGEGLRKMVPYLGEPLEDELHHFPGTGRQVSVAVFQKGYASWNPMTNETTGIGTSGDADSGIWTDEGNHPTAGELIKVLRRPFGG